MIVKADIEISNMNSQTISYSLFYGSLVDLDPKLILRLYEYQHALGSSAIFIPRILTFECPTCPEDIKRQHCISDGSFCFTPPSEEKAQMYPELSDYQLIKENLRELCIYDYIGDLTDEWDMHVFFNYLYNMQFVCLTSDRQLTDECAERVMYDLDIDAMAINSCMKTSFDSYDDWDSYNSLFERDRDSANDLGI